MTEQPTDIVLRDKGLTALEQELGPVQALRFLSLISRQPFDYQEWRRQAFNGMTLSEVLSQATTAQQ